MHQLTRDIRHIVRRLMRSPMFTVITLFTLAIGIGANSAIFSVINGVLLKPLPYANPDRLIALWLTAPGVNIEDLNMSASSYLTFREENRTFEDVGVWNGGSASVTGLAEPEQVQVLFVTESIFPILGAQPAMGRLFNQKDASPGSPATVVLTHDYWQRKFGGDASAVGRSILVDGRQREVIGVLPQGFRFLDRQPAMMIPFQFNRSELFLGGFNFRGVARLKPGVSLAQANADVARMIPLTAQKFPPPPGFNVKMFEQARIGPSLRPLMQDVVGDIGNSLWVIMGTVGMVLLIACANVANLLLVRADGRQQELAIRAALGAGWPRIARELLLESMLLGIAGGALGLGLAYGALQLLISMGPTNLPRLDGISLDPIVLLFTLIVSLFAGLLFGFIPVLKYAGPHLGTALRAGGRTLSQSRERHRARSSLVIIQVALALVLLISSGLMIRTFQALRQVQPGYSRVNEIQTLRISIPEAQVKEPERVARMHHDILQKLSEIPEVESIGLVSGLPTDGSNNDPIFAADHTYQEGQIPPVRRFKYMTPGYLQTVGTPLLAGRDLTWTDVYDKRPVVLVSENLARELWRDPTAALGKRIRQSHSAAWREVVGVVGNVRDDGINQKATTIVYWPILMSDFSREPTTAFRSLSYAIRSRRTGSESFLKQVQQAIWSVNPNLPLASVRTLEEIHNRSMARTSFTLVMLAIAGGMALLLGVVGIYGVISYSVSQRTREIGIRLALGAQQQELKGMFVRHGLMLAGIGVACGLAAAAALTRFMSTLLFEVSPVDPVTYGAVSVGLVAAAVLASYLPARRASAVDPLDALRAE